MRVELYEDEEDSNWVSVIFVIEGWSLSVEDTQPLDDEWYQTLAALIPRDTVWSIGRSIDWLE